MSEVAADVTVVMPEGFVTRRITMAVARIAAGLQDTVELGDIETAATGAGRRTTHVRCS